MCTPAGQPYMVSHHAYLNSRDPESSRDLRQVHIQQSSLDSLGEYVKYYKVGNIFLTCFKYSNNNIVSKYDFY
jgi:hypothetical protein